MTDRVEVCVLGAGPAGSAVATRLAALGHQVVVVEECSAPRRRIGESLSPGVGPLLDSLGVLDRIAAGADVLRSPLATIRWRGPVEQRGPADGGLTVDRAAFDAILLDGARAAGAVVLRPARAGRPRRSSSGWAVPVPGRVLHARFLVDATGRRRALGGRRERTGPPTLALHATWRPRRPAGTARTWIDSGPDGWIWAADLPGGDLRTIAFTDPAVAAGCDREALLGRLLAGSPLLAEHVADAAPVEPVRTCDATTFRTAGPVDRTTIAVGEAAFAIDPLSSSGVQTAIQTALAAGAVVHTLLDPAGQQLAAIRYYRDLVAHAVARHARIAAALYAEHAPHADAEFWRRRGVPAPASPALPPPRPLADLLPLRVRLAADATVAPTPCLVDDRIELRRALVHPSLDRPVAFVAGVELELLLGPLNGRSTLAAALRAWERSVPGVPAAALADWMHRRGLIETA